MPWAHQTRAVPALVAACVLFVNGQHGTTTQKPLVQSVCDIQTSERVVAIGDVHGAYDRLVGILRAAELIDHRARWTGGRAILVQTGDVLDRGPDSRRVLDLLRRLEREAARAGGQVHALVGNHETMRLFAQWQDVSHGELAAFRTRDSEDVRQQFYEALAAERLRQARQAEQPFNERAFRTEFMREVPLGFIEMRHAFSPAGEYGRWLREQNAFVRINGVAFVHGGVNVATAALGCAGINDEVRRDMAVRQPTPEHVLAMLSGSETGPLWYRGLALEPDPEFAPEVTAILGALDVRAIVIGHTPVNGFRIATRFSGRVIQIDTGMLGGTSYPGGVASALEMRGDALTAIYADGRETLAPLP